MKKVWVWMLMVLVVALILGIGLLLLRTDRSEVPPKDVFPANMAGRINFKLYYFNGSVPGDFELQDESVDYKNSLLIFEMKNKNGKKLVFTEQKKPTDYDITQLRADKEFSTATGKAYITDGETRTTAALFTSDGTWVIINAPDPIGGDTMRKIVEALTLTNG